jgi:apolipoprotein N-acyltransferase
MTRHAINPQMVPLRGRRSRSAAGRAVRPAVAEPDAGRAPCRPPRWAWGLPAVTVALQSVVFLAMDPAAVWLDWGVLSFVYLVPWLWLAAQAVPLRRLVLVSYAGGVAFYLINTHYLCDLTALGYVCLALLLGLSYALFGGGVHLLHRRARVPLTVAAPVVWVATEFLRSLGPTALPLLFLSHGLYKHVAFIQIADLTGALGVSFVGALINGLLADLLLAVRPGERAWARRLFVPSAATLFITAATLLYGLARLDSVPAGPGSDEAPSPADGPRIAVIQADYPLSIDGPGVGVVEKRERYLGLIAQALREQPMPDLLLLPETPWTMILNDEFLSAPEVRSDLERGLQDWSLECDQLLQQISTEFGVTVVIGATSLEYFPEQDYPKYRKHNSAFVYSPDGSAKRRYDKVALLMFGEYTPLRGGRLHRVYQWLDGLNPFSSPDDEFSLSPGRTFDTFSLTLPGSGAAAAADGRRRRFVFGIPICFEDLLPAIGRAFRTGPDGGKRADFLLSISNDGWFDHAAAVPQHLAVCVFRAIENRVGIARAVNSSCSGFIDPAGRLHDLVEKDGRVLGRDIFGHAVASVRIDPRVTVYSRYGDWFGLLCTMITVVGVAAAACKK